ncbi:MAG: hypothetical protein K5675_09490, partial [Lachnospiraceae bacterium]|nr:hypothetical protein [Lachnospiraceae bacterium]
KKNEVTTNIKVSKPVKQSSIHLEAGTYIGSDEVGKIEPLKQLIVVAVHVTEDKFDKILELGVNDSKQLPSIEKLNMIGKTLTGFDDYEQIKSGKIYENEEYGLTYCPLILSNEDYNNYHKEKINANAVLTLVHNEANLKLLHYLTQKGIKISDVIIDDYMNGSGNTLFKKYLNNPSFDFEIINDYKGITLNFETKADSKYKAIVGTSSDICAYFDKLWQKYLNNKYAMILDYGNNIKLETLKKSFAKINEIDPKMRDVKHTNTYVDWLKMS